MNKIFGYIKTHKLTIFLLVLVLYFLFRGSTTSLVSPSSIGSSRYTSSTKTLDFDGALPSVGGSNLAEEVAPVANTPDRKVITNSNFSLLVKNVSESIDQIKTKAAEVSGYVIDVNIRRSENSESANLTLRVPSNRVDEVSKYLKSISVKVVSENITGKDITDQYVDVETRIAELYKVKSRLEQIMGNANTSDEMLKVFNQINNINNQIDSYKGQLKYMDSASSTSRLTVALSTDELSLPYAPAQPWKPEAIFKAAVRSMLGTLQGIGTAVIWLAVFSPLILLALLIYVFIKKRRSKTKSLQK